MRVVFMGTPDFAVPTLARLAADGHTIAAVYTRAPSKPPPCRCWPRASACRC
jgi:methionyl-tRNA formyltransferase